MLKRMQHILCIVLIFFCISGCGSGTSLDLSGTLNDPSRFVWGSNETTASLGDVGLFYVDGKLLRFYDMEAQQSFVLCSRANCMHNSDSCAAYFPLTVWGGSAESLAQIGSFLYCTYYSGAASIDELSDAETGSAIWLLRIDPSDGSRKVLASFPTMYNAAENDGAFFASSIGTVQYCGGYAWFDLQMRQQDTEETQGASFSQLCGVDLETGEITELNQYDGYTYSFSAIGPDKIYYTRRRDTVALMTQDEFYASKNDTGGGAGKVTVDGNTFDDYSPYWVWHTNHYPDEYEILEYEISTGQIDTLFSGLTVPVSHPLGAVMQYDPFHVYGCFEGRTLGIEYIPDEAGNYYTQRLNCFLLDHETGERENVLELENGGLLAIAQGYQGNLVFPDGRLFYIQYRDNSADIYVLDLNTGESTFLFNDDPAITFRIFGEYNGGFFGKHKDHQDAMSSYWISEADFYAGNLDSAIRYQL